MLRGRPLHGGSITFDDLRTMGCQKRFDDKVKKLVKNKPERNPE